MATIKKFEEIFAWQKARDLNKLIGNYIDTGRFKNNFRLIGQIEGSAGSIMDNIAEGFERSGNREFLQFLYISKGSCGEFRSQLYRALDRNYISRKNLQRFMSKRKKLLLCCKNSLTILKHQTSKELNIKYARPTTREHVNS
jgi:four helix bundle protein